MTEATPNRVTLDTMADVEAGRVVDCKDIENLFARVEEEDMGVPETCAVCQYILRYETYRKRFEWLCGISARPWLPLKSVPCKRDTLPKPPKWCPRRVK